MQAGQEGERPAPAAGRFGVRSQRLPARTEAARAPPREAPRRPAGCRRRLRQRPPMGTTTIASCWPRTTVQQTSRMSTRFGETPNTGNAGITDVCTQRGQQEQQRRENVFHGVTSFFGTKLVSTSTVSRCDRLASGSSVTDLKRSCGVPPTFVTLPMTRPGRVEPADGRGDDGVAVLDRRALADEVDGELAAVAAASRRPAPATPGPSPRWRCRDR